MAFKSFLGSMSSFFGLEDEEETRGEAFALPKQPQRRPEKVINKNPITTKKQESPTSQTRMSRERKQERPSKKAAPTPMMSTPTVNQRTMGTKTDKKVVPLVGERKNTKQSNQNIENANKIMVLEPRAYSEAMSIAKHVLSGKSVLVNFHLMEEPQARRVVDFLTGTVYAEDGDIKRVSSEMFLCTPPTVEIEGTTKSLEEYNQFDFNQLSL